MYNKVIDFRNRVIIDYEDKEQPFTPSKEDIEKIISEEGLYGFFGLEKPKSEEEKQRDL